MYVPPISASSFTSHTLTVPLSKMPFKRYVEGLPLSTMAGLSSSSTSLTRTMLLLMLRSQMNFKRLSLTDIKIDIKRVPKKKAPMAAMEVAEGLIEGKMKDSTISFTYIGKILVAFLMIFVFEAAFTLVLKTFPDSSSISTLPFDYF